MNKMMDKLMEIGCIWVRSAQLVTEDGNQIPYYAGYSSNINGRAICEVIAIDSDVMGLAMDNLHYITTKLKPNYIGVHGSSWGWFSARVFSACGEPVIHSEQQVFSDEASINMVLLTMLADLAKLNLSPQKVKTMLDIQLLTNACSCKEPSHSTLSDKIRVVPGTMLAGTMLALAYGKLTGPRVRVDANLPILPSDLFDGIVQTLADRKAFTGHILDLSSGDGSFLIRAIQYQQVESVTGVESDDNLFRHLRVLRMLSGANHWQLHQHFNLSRSEHNYYAMVVLQSLIPTEDHHWKAQLTDTMPLVKDGGYALIICDSNKSEAITRLLAKHSNIQLVKKQTQSIQQPDSLPYHLYLLQKNEKESM